MPGIVGDPVPGHVCRWRWDGIEWQASKTGCSVEEDCLPPANPGNFIGQTATTECTVDD